MKYVVRPTERRVIQKNIIKQLNKGRGYLPELLRQIRTYFPELFWQIKTYFPEPVLVNKNVFVGTPSVGSLNTFHLRTGFFSQKKIIARDVSFLVWVVQYSFGPSSFNV